MCKYYTRWKWQFISLSGAPRYQMLFHFTVEHNIISDAHCSTLQNGWVTGEAIKSKTEHDDVIKWKHFPRNWPFVRGIHRSPVNSPHKGQWRGALMFTLICARIKGWVNNREAVDLGRYRGHYDVTVMICSYVYWLLCNVAVISYYHQYQTDQFNHCIKY